FINGGSARSDPKPGEEPPKIKLSGETLALAGAIEQMSCPIIVLSQVPYQPMFGGRKEDALIAFTFDKFLLNDGGERSNWPLMLPMTKSAVRAMDASAAFLKK